MKMWRGRTWSVLIILAGVLAGCPSPGGPGNMINVAGHGLKVGDAVYVEASGGTLVSGAYLVTVVQDADNFGTDAVIHPGDSFNYLAKIQSNGGTAF